MSVTKYNTLALVSEIIQRTAASLYTEAEIVLCPKTGDADDEVDTVFFEPELNSRFRIRVSGLTSGAAGNFVAAMQVAQAAKKQIVVTFRVGAVDGAANTPVVAIVTQPSTTASTNTAFAIQPVVGITDTAGDALAMAGIVVTATRTTGTDTLGGTATATTDARGLATFTNLKLTTAGGTHTDKLTFSATGFTSSAETTGIAVS